MVWTRLLFPATVQKKSSQSILGAAIFAILTLFGASVCDREVEPQHRGPTNTRTGPLSSRSQLSIVAVDSVFYCFK